MSNNGIIQHGGTINAQKIAVGDHASISSSNEQNVKMTLTAKEEAIGLLDQVVQRLTQLHSGSDHRNVVEAIGTMKVEINKEQPNKLTVGSLGTAVLENLKQISDSDTLQLFQAAFNKIQP